MKATVAAEARLSRVERETSYGETRACPAVYNGERKPKEKDLDNIEKNEWTRDTVICSVFDASCSLPAENGE